MTTYSETRKSFSSLLHWHLINGTRPLGDKKGDNEWRNQEFAGALKRGITDKAVRNWRAGRNIPRLLDHIERALFGDEVTGKYATWRDDLRAAYAEAARGVKEPRNNRDETDIRADQDPSSITESARARTELHLRSTPGATFEPTSAAGDLEKSANRTAFTTAENAPAADWLDILRTKSGLDDFTKHIQGPDDLSAIEGCISKSSDPALIRNALVLIARLARGWDGRTIKRAASFTVVKNFYSMTEKLGLKVEAARTLASLGTTASRKFLSGDLKQMEPEVLAETLAVWNDEIAFWQDTPYWRSQIEGDLIAWISKPVEDSFFIDGDGKETDCRHGVFRILAELKIQEAIGAIENYIIKADGPTEVIVQAAGAHWRITGSERFVPSLEGAVHSYASTAAKQWLEEIRLSKSPKIVVTEHKTEYDIEIVKGVFARDKYFNFLVYLESEPSVDTYMQTRIAEMYISADDVTQWSWHALNQKEPDWRYGRILLIDLMAGLKENNLIESPNSRASSERTGATPPPIAT